MSSLVYISQQMTFYWGTLILLTGLLGGILNCIIFLSLKTFRQSSCAFYLTIMSFFNIGQLLMSVFSRIMITGFNIDWTQNSLFYCKFRIMFLHLCSLASFTCMCLATIDQFIATCSHHRWQQFNNIKSAYYLTAIATLIWIFHEIPALTLYDIVNSPTSGKMSCINTNVTYEKYVIYIYLLILTGILPMFINIIFGSLAYRNVRQIPYRTVPLVRRELDKQLTSMVLVQVVYSSLIVFPYIITNILIRATTLSNDPITAEILNFTSSVTGYLYYMYFIGSFYIYICVSNRFRQQVMYVLFHIFNSQQRQHHQHQQQQQRHVVTINQIVPDG